MKKFFMFIIVLFLFSLSSCSSGKNKAVKDKQYSAGEYISEEYVYAEDGGQGGLVRTMETIQAGQTLFCFEESIALPERDACINITLDILEKLEFYEPFSVYVFAEGSTPNTEIRENTILTCIRDWKTADYITSVMQAIYGEYTLYGMVYGYVCHLSWLFEGYAFPEESKAIYENIAEGYYDLNCLCFCERFVTEDNIQNAKKISADFIDWLIRLDGENKVLEYIVDSNKIENLDEVNGLLQKFYQENHVEYQPFHAMVKMGGCSLDYVIKTGKGTFFVPLNWKDGAEESTLLIKEGFLHTDYDEVKDYFELNLTQLAAFDEKLGAGVDLSETRVCFMTGGNSNTGMTHTIYLSESMALLHEYVHQITIIRKGGAPDTFIGGEGLATYYMAAVPNLYYTSRANDILLGKVDVEIPEDQVFMMQQLADFEGRPVDFTYDMLDFNDMLTWFYDIEMDKVAYQAGASYCRYIVDMYGEDKLLEFLFDTTKDYSVFGDDKTETAIHDEWVDWLNHKFEGYLNYKAWTREQLDLPWKDQ